MEASSDFVANRDLATTLGRMAPETDNLGAFRKGNIVSIQDGPPATCTITLSGDSTQIAGITFIDSYLPVVGDTVILAKQAGSLLILGTVEPRPPAMATLLIERLANQSVNSSTNTQVLFDTLSMNVGWPATGWVAGTPGNIVCPWPGLYRVSLNCTWDANATGARVIHLHKGTSFNTANYVAGQAFVATAANETSQYNIIDRVIQVATAGETYQVWVTQQSGATLNLSTQFGTKPARCAFSYIGKS